MLTREQFDCMVWILEEGVGTDAGDQEAQEGAKLAPSGLCRERKWETLDQHAQTADPCEGEADY